MAQSWNDSIVTSVQSEGNQQLVGKTLQEISQQRQQEPIDAMVDLILEEEAHVNIVSFNQSEANLRALLTDPNCTVISDGFYVNGRPHPRLFGTFPELLGRYVRDLAGSLCQKQFTRSHESLPSDSDSAAEARSPETVLPISLCLIRRLFFHALPIANRSKRQWESLVCTATARKCSPHDYDPQSDSPWRT